ncbi:MULTISPECIES: MobC family plasmid mobilization relaxosome protein [Pseudomonas]|uniref:MobC family plasmid mobilization relaxosome protein n=1 Tax=Pseudomonas guariconensis TaxID=1288410 RepID=UPI00209851FB|nr:MULTISPECIES: MobC family plasmid mobilization relaxosome protein [Pseudomonas]MCO7597249.1 MobC family plasmid mobilization relaxosome protein [Pseudomonas guariconensis]MCU7222159.1 MobC family plasmid mobilization relaxosome protein [Pseudomonas brassicacearum]
MDRKTARLCLRITPSDKKAIVAKARNLHLSTADWLIRSALDREIIPPRSVWDAQSINQLSRIGNNLNQLAHWANCGVHIDEEALREVAVELRALRGLLDDF